MQDRCRISQWGAAQFQESGVALRHCSLINMAAPSENNVTAPEKPKNIDFGSLIVDVKCHPSKNLLATGNIDGNVELYSFSVEEENHKLFTFDHHKKSCRAVRFSGDGEKLFTASKDKSLQVVDLNAGKVILKHKSAHESPIYSLCVISEHQVATGDDDGVLKVWDDRQPSAIMEFKENEEYVSDMYIDSQRKFLLATNGDGTLTAFNIRKKRMEMQSEVFDSEFLSMAVVKQGQKVICGSGEGILNIFNWGEWGNISDRFPLDTESVDCIMPISENVICVGSMDGKIQAVGILPNEILGEVGSHGDYPIENMDTTQGDKFLVSCSHDQSVKFWSLDKVHKVKLAKGKAKKSAKKKLDPKGDFFADLDDAPAAATSKETADSDDDDDENDSDSDSD